MLVPCCASTLNEPSAVCTDRLQADVAHGRCYVRFVPSAKIQFIAVNGRFAAIVVVQLRPMLCSLGATCRENALSAQTQNAVQLSTSRVTQPGGADGAYCVSPIHNHLPRFRSCIGTRRCCRKRRPSSAASFVLKNCFCTLVASHRPRSGRVIATRVHCRVGVLNDIQTVLMSSIRPGGYVLLFLLNRFTRLKFPGN